MSTKKIFNSETLYKIAILFILLSGVLLRLYTLLFFEFKDDQAMAILGGLYTKNSSFLISHGMVSGVNVPNPPGFFYFMGLLTMFTEEPFAIASVFCIIQILSLLLSYYLFKNILDRESLLFFICLTAFSPPLVTYSSNIWAQNLIPILGTAVFYCTIMFIKSGLKKFWLLSLVFTATASQIHLSGFFLFPFIIMTAFLKKIPPKMLFAGLAIVSVFFVPYAIYVLKDYPNIILHSENGIFFTFKNTFKTLAEFHSISFFKYYFGADCNKICAFFMGEIISGFFFTLASLLFITALFCGLVLGICSSLKIFILQRLPYDKNSLFVSSIASMYFLSILAGYLILSVKVFPHYFLITLPCGYLIIALAFRTIPSRIIRRILFCFGMFSATLLLISVLVYIDSAGGHPYEYGPHHGLQTRWKNELKTLFPDYQVDIGFEIGKTASSKFDERAVKFKLTPYYYTKRETMSAKPLKKVILSVDWDQNRQCYIYEWNEQK